MTVLRVAIVGFGKIARDQHVPAIAATDGVTLAAVASRNARLPDVPHFATLEELLARRSADRCGGALHAAAGAARPGRGSARSRQARDAGEAAGRQRWRARSADRDGRAAGRTLFATWHSRFAPAVEPARQWLASRRIRSVHINWKEDVRVWHPGQGWIWEPGGLGVFDPGINALSILTRILPQPAVRDRGRALLSPPIARRRSPRSSRWPTPPACRSPPNSISARPARRAGISWWKPTRAG